MAVYSKEFIEEVEKANADAEAKIMLGPEEIKRRFGFHPANEDTKNLHRRAREAFQDFAWFIDAYIPNGPESARAKTCAFTALEECSMWTNKAIAAVAPVTEVI